MASAPPMKRLSGLQKQVFALYRSTLSEAAQKDRQRQDATIPFTSLLQNSDSTTTSYAKTDLQRQAQSVKRTDFRKIEYMLRLQPPLSKRPQQQQPQVLVQVQRQQLVAQQLRPHQQELPKAKKSVPRTVIQTLLLIYCFLLGYCAVAVLLLRWNVAAYSPATVERRQQLWNQEAAFQIFFVHVGKTGGTSIGSMLKIFCQARVQEDSRQYCLDQWEQRHSMDNTTKATHYNETLLSQYTHGFVHVTGWYPLPPPAESSTMTTTSTSGAAASAANGNGSPSNTNHQDHQAQILQASTHLLMSLRNPIDRVVSWFYYMHPRNCYTSPNGTPLPRQPFTLIDKACITKRRVESSLGSREYEFYQACFPTVNELAMALDGQGQAQQHLCHKLARETLAGQGGPNGMAGHLWANYTYYAHVTNALQPTYPLSSTQEMDKPELWVIRTSHLWKDLQHVESIMLEGNGTVFAMQEQPKSPTNTGNDKEDSNQEAVVQPPYHKDPLSPEGYAMLCCALQAELDVYRQLLFAATNLEPQEKEGTLRDVLQNCKSTAATNSSTNDGDDESEVISTMEQLKRYCDETYPMVVPI